MNIGITFGCFIPLHKGHLVMISKSRYKDDKTIIGVCGYANDRGKDFISFDDRYNLMKLVYQNDPNVIVVKIDDKKLGLDGTFTLNNWKLWCEELFTNAQINPYDDNNYVWYSGEESYFDKIKQLYPNHQFELLDRSKINISGTEIRRDIKNYRDMIHPVFREYLRKKESDLL